MRAAVILVLAVIRTIATAPLHPLATKQSPLRFARRASTTAVHSSPFRPQLRRVVRENARTISIAAAAAAAVVAFGL